MPLISTIGGASAFALRSNNSTPPTAPASLAAYFPGGTTTYSISVGGSVLVTSIFDGVADGQFLDYISFQTMPSGGSPTQWEQVDFSPAADSSTDWKTYNPTGLGYPFNQAGTYDIFLLGVYNGVPVISSSSITLTVT